MNNMRGMISKYWTLMIVIVTFPVLVAIVWTMSESQAKGQVQKDREGFQKAEAAAAATIDELSSLLGEPLYVDKNNRCSYEIVGKNPEEQLYCDTLFAAYYSLELNSVTESADSIKRIINKRYPPPIVEFEYNTNIPLISYMFGAQEIDSFNNLSCAMSIRYPEKGRSNHLLPERTFNQKNILSIAVHCNKHVAKRVY